MIIVPDGAFTNYIANKYNNSNNTYDLNLIQAKVAIEAGCDTECGTFYQTYLEMAYNASLVSEETIDLALSRLFTKMFELGLMDDPKDQFYKTLNYTHVDTHYNRQVALDAARQGIVLLKNDNNILPISSTSVSNIALIGPHANATKNMLSSYEGTNTLVNSHSPYQSFVREIGDSVTISYEQGCNAINCTNTSGFANAVKVASNADYAFVFLGLCPGYTPQCHGAPQESEGHDRYEQK